MALRLHRVTDDTWQRLAAIRRSENQAAVPPRAAIGAIESEIRSLAPQSPDTPAADFGGGEFPRAANA